MLLQFIGCMGVRVISTACWIPLNGIADNDVSIVQSPTLLQVV